MDERTTELERRMTRFRETCEREGVRLTHQRLEVFRCVASSDQHPDAETIYRALQERLPTLSLDTVYRNLWLLYDLGLVNTVALPKGRLRFDPNTAPHQHVVCTRCGLIRDFELAGLHDLPLPAAVHEFGQIDSRQLEIRGVCRACLAAAD